MKFKKKRRVATKAASDSVKMRLIDPFKIVAENFLKNHVGTKMFCSIDSNMFLCVKVLSTVRPGKYENILVKLLETPGKEFENNLHGYYFNKDGISKSKKLLKAGKMMYVNHLSLYTPEQAKSLIDKSLHMCIENLIVARSHVKNNKQRRISLEQNKKNVEKFSK